MNKPKGYTDIEYLRDIGKLTIRLKERTYEAMQIKAGDKVLDVGCGPGTDTIPLARLVGPTGEVYGVDYDAEMVNEADLRAKQAGVGGWVHHRKADASAIPFEVNSFNACRSERLFQHLLDPATVLREMKRVTKRGGWVVVLDTDWGSGGTDTYEVELERRLMRFFVEHLHNNGYAGRQLYRLFITHGLQEVSYEVFPIVATSYAMERQIIQMDQLEKEAIAQGIVTQEELRRITEGFSQADKNGVFFGYACQIMVAGKKAE